MDARPPGDRRRLRRLGRAALVLGVLVSLLVIAGYLRARTLLARRYEPPLPALELREDPETLARGRYLARTILGCAACHGEDMAGAEFLDLPLVVRVAGTNLTPAGATAGYDDEDWLRAIRHGAGPEGQALRFMGGGPIALIAPEDLAALIVYLRSLEPIEREPKPLHLRPLGALGVLFGELDLTHAARVDHQAPLPPARPEIGVNMDYGRYLADIAGCRDCHRPNLAGGPYPGAPPWFPEPTNLTAAHMGEWSYAEFRAAMQEGRGVDGRSLHTFMPWPSYLGMHEDDLRALWLYVSTRPPAATASVPFDDYRTHDPSDD